MIKRPRLIRAFTRRIDAAVNAVASRYETEIADEDDFTSRLLERMVAELDRWTYAGITLRVRKLTSKGTGSEEAVFGADVVAVLNIDVDEYRADKGILVQAKRLEPGHRFGTRDWKDLDEQIRKMTAHTNESYVWCYGPTGVRSVKAANLRNLQSRRPDDLYVSKCARFFGEFAQCKHGDPRIRGHERQALTRLTDEYGSKSAVSFSFRN